MSDKSKIEWCDTTWNVVAGCSKISPGCKFCYAERMAKRQVAMGCARGGDNTATWIAYSDAINPKTGKWSGEIALRYDQLDKPLHWKEPRRIFLCSMSDLFHEKVPFSFTDKIFDVMYKCPRHTFLILTKRPKQALSFVGEKGEYWFTLPNVHFGISISNQAEADEKIPILLQIPAAVRWLSIEPMLGAIDLRCVIVGPRRRCVFDCLRGTAASEIGVIKETVCGTINSVIVGGESGPGARPMHPDWPRNIRDQCVAANVPFYFKQWGAWEIANKENATRNGYVVTESRQGFLTPYNKKKFVNLNGDGSYYRDNPQPNSIAMARVGKKKAGCILDGKIWKQLLERK